VLSFCVVDTPADGVLQTISLGLDQHNFSVAPLSDVKPLAVTAADEAGSIVAGAVGRTWGRCCELQELWVDEAYRRQGVATSLLQRFESHAESRGCHTYYLTTLSFQAPDFYRKHGYSAIAEIDGYPDGIVKYLMYKTSRQS
jgi:ribosomal protein S18 acetylase RimI-like enzyme